MFYPNLALSMGRGVNRYHTNLIVLQTYYKEDVLGGIDGASSFSELADLNLPYHKVELIDTDEPTHLKLKAILNATGNNRKLYSNFWRNPDFLLADNIYSYAHMGANGFLVLMIGVIFIYQQYKIRQIHAFI